jgi:hypothetical protein
VAERTESICRRSETEGDQNVIVAFANGGVTTFSPSLVPALGLASTHVTHEATGVSAAVARQGSSTRALAEDLGSESEVLDRSAHAIQLSRDQIALLTVLHRSYPPMRGAGPCVG